MIHYRKIGGLHWFAIGSLRISICFSRKQQAPLQCVALRHRIIGNQAVRRELQR